MLEQSSMHMVLVDDFVLILSNIKSQQLLAQQSTSNKQLPDQSR